jgi:hypothetical protein
MDLSFEFNPASASHSAQLHPRPRDLVGFARECKATFGLRTKA